MVTASCQGATVTTSITHEHIYTLSPPFSAANAIEDAKIVPTFLSVMGARTFTLLRSLVQPAKPGEPVAIKGVMDVEVELNGQSATLPLYVVKGNYPALLGREWLETDRWCQKKTLGSVLFWKNMLRYSRMDWDRTIRICGDFKVAVNPVSSPDQYLLPLIDDLFAGPAGGQRFNKIDLCQAYLQMKVNETSKELLTIVTHKGLFRYQCLPFGVTSALSLFQRAMDQVLSGLAGLQCYLDDILVTGKTEAEHLSNLDSTLQHLKEYGLRVRKDKLEFFKQSVEYLGHVINADGPHKAQWCTGVPPAVREGPVAGHSKRQCSETLQKTRAVSAKAPSKVRAILEAPAPQNTSQLQSFIGLLNYYGRFINGLATLLKPLHQLLCSNQPWEWTQQCETTFQKAKKALVKSGALTHFNPYLLLQLACDASPYGVGAVISHIINTSHGTTKASPAFLMLKCLLRSGFDLLRPSTVKKVVTRQQQKQVHRRDIKAKRRLFHPGQNVLACNYTSGLKWVPATVIAQTGTVSYTVLTWDKFIWKRHLDQLLLGSTTDIEVSAATPNACSDTPVLQEVNVDTSPAPLEKAASQETENMPQMQNSENQPKMDCTSFPKSMSSAERCNPTRERRPPTRLDL
ncbi:Transposon Ty3-I Gag-Pol polyprotein [Labeo rohita]|uniref:ribonuclease H n=1 Tax=Labeo rohita TaxID=84645 RepID=A0ABQ8M0B0_LABRO|nr:Transposon Ty3-I Gag-Pol polyprotein [Labeo rohita]